MKINGINNTTFTGRAYKIFNPPIAALREAAMGYKSKHGYYVLIAKADGDDRMIDILENTGQRFHGDYFISKKNYSEVGKPLNVDTIEKAIIEFDPVYANKEAGKIPQFQYDIPAVKTA